MLLIFSSCPEAQENEHRVAVFLPIIREVRFESPFLFALCSSGTVLLASRVSSFRRRSISAAEWLCCDAATFTRLATFIVSFDASSPSQSTLLQSYLLCTSSSSTGSLLLLTSSNHQTTTTRIIVLCVKCFCFWLEAATVETIEPTGCYGSARKMFQVVASAVTSISTRFSMETCI